MKPHTHDVTATAPRKPQATRPATPTLTLILRILCGLGEIVYLYVWLALDTLIQIIATSAAALAEEFSESDTEYLRDADTLRQPKWLRWVIRAWNGEAGLPGALFAIAVLIVVLCACWWYAGMRGLPN